jgi:putative copper resistance protein D
VPIVIVASLFLHYATAMTIFGAAAFRLAVAASEAEGVDGRLRPVLRGAWVLLALSAIALLMGNAGAMGGSWGDTVDPETIGAVLTDTGFGRVWQGHLVLVILAGIALARARPQGPWIAATAMLVMASLGLVGHAAMNEGLTGELHRLNQVIHLLAAGAWVGGLLTLFAAVLALRTRHEVAAALLYRFSRYGTIALVLVLASGAVNAALLVGSLQGLTGSVYGWTLLVKLTLVAVMIVVACRNRFVLTPELAASPAPVPRQLYRSIGLEVAIGFAIVLVASLLGTLAPPGV